MRLRAFSVKLTDEQSAQVSKEWADYGSPCGAIVGQPVFRGCDVIVNLAVYDANGARRINRAVVAANKEDKK